MTRPPALGYLVKAFPRISETFIANEILQLEAQGFRLHLCTMTRPRDTQQHRLAAGVRAPRTRLPERWALLAPSALAAQVRLLARHPLAYVATLLRVLARRDRELLEHFFQAACLASRLDADGVVHLHAGFIHAPGSVAWLVHRLTGRSFSLACHAKDLYHSDTWLLRRKFEAAGLVFTCTRYNLLYLSTLGGPEGLARVRHVYHGTDLRRFEFGPCGEASPPVVLAVARLVEKKGLDDLVRACAILRERDVDFRCRIVGAGPLEGALRAQIAAGRLDEVVTLEGALDQDQVLARYRQATVLAAPSVVTGDGDRDGIPNVLVEAAACGVPIVSTPVSGIPELIEDARTGLLVPPHDPRALAAAIERLLHSPDLRARLRLQARARVEADLDLQRNAIDIGRELDILMRQPAQRRVRRMELHHDLRNQAYWR
jgi:glycosyltransferase involved in cell wall biosynthesis